jgi:hypothetical protein
MENFRKLINYSSFTLAILMMILSVNSCLSAEENDVKKKDRYDEGWSDGFDCGWDAREPVEIEFDSKYGLKGLKKIVIDIDIDKNNELNITEYLSNYIQLRLRTAGIKIVEKDEDLETGTLTIWYRIIKATRNSEEKYHMRINAELYQYASIRRRLEKKYIDYASSCITWRNGEILFLYESNPKFAARNWLEECLDQFINLWLKENQKKDTKI